MSDEPWDGFVVGVSNPNRGGDEVPCAEADVLMKLLADYCP
jgi:hypothetical protein